MAKPVLLIVDSDQKALDLIVQDLEQRYRDRCRVIGQTSESEALEILQKLKRDSEPVALLLVDQQMAKMTAAEFLKQATDLFPAAKRVFLTSYKDA